MSLLLCKECQKEISSTASQCPHCGASQSKMPGCFGCLKIVGILFVFMIIIAAFNGGSGKVSTKDIKSYEMGSPVTLKDMEVIVASTEYVNSIKDLNEFSTEAGSGIYLIVFVSVKNNSDQPMYVNSSIFTIMRGTSKYDVDSTATMYAALKYKRQQLTKLNPGISAEGIIVFNLPDIKTPSELKISYSAFGPYAKVRVI